jgi:hypothetical protein
LLAKMTLEEKVGQLNLFNVDKTDLEQAIAAGKVGARSTAGRQFPSGIHRNAWLLPFQR